MTKIAIVGSAYADGVDQDLEEIVFETPFGDAVLHRIGENYLCFRHGLPHRLLPNQIGYRANTFAFREAGCEALLVTSSVGVMTKKFPLFEPLLVSDLVMLENRLPDGSACTMFTKPRKGQGHLVLEEGLFSTGLHHQIRDRCSLSELEPVFAYVQGPRTKTKTENRVLPTLGADVNSMTFAPEVVLANEFEIPVAGVVVGHKHSLETTDDELDIADSLVASKAAMSRLVDTFLNDVVPVPFANSIYRF